jgi:hypothetical protein
MHQTVLARLHDARCTEKGGPMDVGVKRTRRSLLATLSTAALLLSLVLIAPSLAQTGGNPDHSRAVFELDGNANNSTLYAGEDWSDVFAGTSHASATTGIVSEPDRAYSIFTGGGSKDPNDISAWRWKNGGGLPDKDNLLHAFAARYGDLIVFGSDRYDNSGDAQQGFWFFQNAVTTNSDGTFSGVHKEGDLLILSDFSIGGTVSIIAVYKWVDSGGDVATHLLSLFNSSEANCLDAKGNPTSGDVCGVVNPSSTTGNQTGGWDFTDKSGNDYYLQGEFFEGGINLAAFSDFAGECFASFASETRSSTSPTATLKDFVLGGFQACETSTVTTPSDSNGAPLSSIVLGGSIYDSALITGTGSSNAPTGTMDFFVCAPDELTGGVCATGGTQVNGSGAGALNDPVAVTPVAGTSTSTSISSAFTPDAIGTWCWRGVYSGDGDYPTASDASTGECFEVTDIASTATTQSWLPQDTATITAAGGSTIAGTVTFSLYESADCTGTPVQTFADLPVTSGMASTNNTTYYTTATTISWRAVFASTNDVAAGDASHCETMTVSTLNNDTGS